MASVPTLGEALTAAAKLFPARIGARDQVRTLAFRSLNARACRLANALLGLGLSRGDRVAVLAYNRLEWIEIYGATAKAGLMMVPINFRLTAPEVAYIITNSGARAIIVQDALVDKLEAAREAFGPGDLVGILLGEGGTAAGYRRYEDVLGTAQDTEPSESSAAGEPWAVMYTSGTTGRPKGAVRSHLASALLALATAVELGFSRRDVGLLVMPMCHGNSLFFAAALAYCGGACHVYDGRSFDPEHVLAVLASGPTFTSLVPTQYVMLLEIPERQRARHDTRGVSKLMISSAPARRETKQAVMEAFPNSALYEGYGSTEAGWVTMLHPEEQMQKLGSVGREIVGTRPIRLLDPVGCEVIPGEVGELHSSTPFTFDGYWHLPEKTAEAFRDGYCTVGDMARRDEDGFLYLVGRKSNMIITGGENVYPSEVETLIAAHPAVSEVAVIGLPDGKWGEQVHAVVVLRTGAAATEADIIDWCCSRLAGFKRPRGVSFIPPEAMPRTATGKIQHRVLKSRLLEKGAA